VSQARVSWLLILAALCFAAWAALAWGVEVDWLKGRTIGHYFFRSQDLPALMMGCGALLLGGLAIRLAPEGRWSWGTDRRIVLPAIAAFALMAWSGRYWLFGNYSLSRDEEVAEFAARAMRDGFLGRPIPPEWIAYRRAIMPEFFSPFGADAYWNSAYLPLNSAFRALCDLIGDPNLSGPVFLVIGMIALWRAARRILPEHPQAIAVTMLMALTSAQLLVTGMTPYAMTAHFALNMVWLALVLRGDRPGHVGAGLTVLILAGLHQYHYPLVFLTPFLLWFALQRRWGALAFHMAAIALAVAVWAKLWPHLMIDWYGPPADVRPSAGVADKMSSLAERLEEWRPLLYMSRFFAWNNLLLVPLALVGLWRMGWRAALKGERIALPLGLGALGMAALAISPGYGWGYRYLHGFIGSFALLAGLGWASLKRRDTRVLAVSALIALLMASFLMSRARDYVAPYAEVHRRILASGADVVLVDPRGGRYVTDLVRGPESEPLGNPVVMSIGWLRLADLDRLCASKDVAVLDISTFVPLGVGVVPWGNRWIAQLRAHMAERGCGREITP